MTKPTIALSASEERRLEQVEMDVRRAMKEACKCYEPEINAALKSHVIRRKKLAKQLLALALSALVTGCGIRYEIYSYSPDEFERNDRQVYREELQSRRVPK